MIAAGRVLPPALLSTRRPHRMIERALIYYRRWWMVLISGFAEPLFYLLSIRIGINQLVGDVQVGGRTVRYVEFVAPALLASAAMNGAVVESTMNVYEKLKYARVYDAVLATPMGAGDIALGEIAWSLMRGAIYAAMFTVIMSVMGLAASPWVVLCIPIAILIGFAFAAVGMAATTYLRSWADFEYVFLFTMPMFLFSGSFFPVTELSPGLRAAVYATPLYHGVELARSAATGRFSGATPIHVAYLAVMGVVGLIVATRRIERLLLR